MQGYKWEAEDKHTTPVSIKQYKLPAIIVSHIYRYTEQEAEEIERAYQEAVRLGHKNFAIPHHKGRVETTSLVYTHKKKIWHLYRTVHASPPRSSQPFALPKGFLSSAKTPPPITQSPSRPAPREGAGNPNSNSSTRSVG